MLILPIQQAISVNLINHEGFPVLNLGTCALSAERRLQKVSEPECVMVALVQASR